MTARKATLAIRQMSRGTGAVRTAHEHIEALKSLGFDVTVLAERIPAESEALGVEWKRVWRWPLKGYVRRRWFDRWVQYWNARLKPDICVSHGDARTDDILVMHNCVCLAHERITGGPLSPHDELYRAHERLLRPDSFRVLLANSELMKRDFVSRYGVPPQKVKVVYPAVDRALFSPNDHRQKRLSGRAELGVGDAEPLVGLVTSGNLEKRNAEFFLRLAAVLRRSLPETPRFLIVGKGWERYSRQAHELGIADRMLFRDPTADVEFIYHALDVFVLPAHIEEFGRVVLEALSCGTPSLVSANVGAAELMTEAGMDGVMPDYDLERWADAVERLLGSERAQHESREAATALASRYDRERQKHVLMDIFSSLCRYRPKQ